MQKKEITKLQSNYRWEKTTGRKRQEDNIEGKQENEPNVKRIPAIENFLFGYNLGPSYRRCGGQIPGIGIGWKKSDQRVWEITKGDY